MCRIDAPFSNLTLNEKSNPIERFEQALDENGVHGEFRSLLLKHFAENWQKPFGDIDAIDKALNEANKHNSIQQKIKSIIQDEVIKNKLPYMLSATPLQLPHWQQPLIDFISEAAKSFFRDSPYELWKTICEGRIGLNFNDFLSYFYGEDFCFSEEFFADKSLTAMNSRDRVNILWRLFDSMTSTYSDSSDDPQIQNLISYIDGDTQSKATREFERGLKFLEAWILNDAKAGRFLSDEFNVFTEKNYLQNVLEQRLTPKNSGLEIPEEKLEVVTDWLKKKDKEIELLQYVGADLSFLTEEQKKQWIHGLNSYFLNAAYEPRGANYENYSSVKQDSLTGLLGAIDENYYDVEQDVLREICNQLSQLQIKTWMEEELEKDICALQGKKLGSIGDPPRNSQKWCFSEYYSLWKEVFLSKYSLLGSHEKLKLLSSVPPFQDDVPSEEGWDWWKSMLLNLFKENDFPSELIPYWYLAARSHVKDVELKIYYLDKSIGILRRKLANDSTPELAYQLKNLIDELQRLDPMKALRHQLLLMRTTTDLIRDEAIDQYNSFGDERGVIWYTSLKQFVQNLASKKIKGERNLSFEEREQRELKCYEETSLKLAEFCLSRLRLRKGEKATDKQYQTHQVTEPSAIWRQGYIKALGELGFDLNGKVHKTLHFIQQADPDKGVRDVAKEAYRSVRRENKKSHSLMDFRRGIIAAEWWLLLCQRQELNAPINYEEALKTRRRLLRR
ncbi:hypothetical protein [Terasakiella pusilla]|uniref:hypothetical protein n=1 Tax=Terasakiella pusilla TaxID=64973 RepID=UPI003AA7EEEF